MQTNMDAVFYVESGPEIEVRNGVFHVTYRIGKCRFDLVLPPHAFRKAVRKAAGLLTQFDRASGENVVPMRASGHG